jgi:hypothetical protein
MCHRGAAKHRKVVAELSSIVAWHGQQTIDGEKPSIRTTKEKEFVERIKSDSVFENEKSFSGSILFDFVFPTGDDFLCRIAHRRASRGVKQGVADVSRMCQPGVADVSSKVNNKRKRVCWKNKIRFCF